MDTAALRGAFLGQGLFAEGETRLIYTHYDRMIAGGVLPAGGSLTLDQVKECGTASVLDRREMGVVIHFAHLRNVRKDPDGSFEEAAHLDGDTDMVALISVLLEEEARRRVEGRADAVFPFRPDHGHELLSDIGKGTAPGYPLIGRLRGLAELRGVIRALSHPATRLA